MHLSREDGGDGGLVGNGRNKAVEDDADGVRVGLEEVLGQHGGLYSISKGEIKAKQGISIKGEKGTN
jgi:hypothetical protein